MLIVTKHAVDRYIERLDVDMTTDAAFNILVFKLKYRRKEIEDVLYVLGEARMDIDDGLRAICKMKDKDVVVVTVRREKWK